MKELLRVEGLEVDLGPRAVLRGVDLQLRAGEVVGVLGPNGAGKTTLLRVLTGAIPPRRGAIHVAGEPAGSFTLRERARRIALVPQETQVPFPFRVGEIVLMGRSPHLGWLAFEGPADVRIAEAAMERLGIAHLADRPLLELSGGERQLAVVARALAQEADILLLDEPTAFLDLRHRLEVLQAVRLHAQTGRGALVVSHDLALAARACDRLVLLGGGRVVAAGAAADVLAPEPLRRAFGIEASVVRGPDGEPLVVPLRPAPSSGSSSGAPPRLGSAS